MYLNVFVCLLFELQMLIKIPNMKGSKDKVYSLLLPVNQFFSPVHVYAQNTNKKRSSLPSSWTTSDSCKAEAEDAGRTVQYRLSCFWIPP